MSRETTSRYGASSDQGSSQLPDDIVYIIMDMRERIARVEQRVDSIESDVREMKELLNRFLVKRNGLIKFLVGAMIVIIGIVLSFVAAVLGVHWTPPT